MYIPVYSLIFSFNMIFYKTKIFFSYICQLPICSKQNMHLQNNIKNNDSNIDASLCSHAGACLYERFYVILTMALKHYCSKMQAFSQEPCDMKIFTSGYFFISE